MLKEREKEKAKQRAHLFSTAVCVDLNNRPLLPPLFYFRFSIPRSLSLYISYPPCSYPAAAYSPNPVVTQITSHSSNDLCLTVLYRILINLPLSRSELTHIYIAHHPRVVSDSPSRQI